MNSEIIYENRRNIIKPEKISDHKYSEIGLFITNLLFVMFIITEIWLIAKMNWQNFNDQSKGDGYSAALILLLLPGIVIFGCWCFYSFEKIKSDTQRIKIIKRTTWSRTNTIDTDSYLIYFEHYIYTRYFTKFKLKKIIWEFYESNVTQELAMNTIKKWLTNKKAEQIKKPVEEVIIILNVEEELKKITL